MLRLGLQRRLLRPILIVSVAVLASAALAAGAAAAIKQTIAVGFTIPNGGGTLTVNEGVHVLITATAVRGTQHTVRITDGGPPPIEAGHSASIDLCHNSKTTETVTATDVVEGKSTVLTVTWIGTRDGRAC